MASISPMYTLLGISRLETDKIVKKGLYFSENLSAIKSNEQLLTDSQCNVQDYVDINIFIDQNFIANDVDIMVFEPSV